VNERGGVVVAWRDWRQQVVVGLCGGWLGQFQDFGRRIAVHQEELELYWNERGSGQGNDTCCHSVGKANALVEI